MAETVKHTPAPWKVRPHWSDEARFEVYPDRVVEFGAPAEIADVSGHSAKDIDLEIAEAFANANLISAAPELLDALSKLTAECVKQSINFGPLIADAQVAIAKAEGRA